LKIGWSEVKYCEISVLPIIEDPASSLIVTFERRCIEPLTYLPGGTSTIPPPFLLHSEMAVLKALVFMVFPSPIAP